MNDNNVKIVVHSSQDGKVEMNVMPPIPFS
jgi:hypothetical protein